MAEQEIKMDSEPAVTAVSPGQRGGTDSQGKTLAYTITDEQRLLRFLILGSEGGSYYSKESELTAENAQCVARLVQDGQGKVVVDTVVEVVQNGRCIRMNAALLVLALCCRSQDPETRLAAYHAVPDVCSIPTHLFSFIDCMKKCHPESNPENDPKKDSKTIGAGWGRSMRKAVAMWYNKFATDPQRLAMLVTKYRQRAGWSHHDVIRLGHIRSTSTVIGFILHYMDKGMKEAKAFYLQDGTSVLQDPLLPEIIQYLEAVDEARCLLAPKRHYKDEVNKQDPIDDSQSDADTVQRLVTLIRQFRLLREHVPSTFLRFQKVWQVLAEEMPLTALIRNLNRITISGLLDNPENLKMILCKLGNTEALRKDKVHPYTILTAWYIYRSGKGAKGSLHWNPVTQVCQTLEQAFYAAFDNVESTNKRIMIALNVSDSMASCTVRGNDGSKSMSARVASAAMCLVTLYAESCVDVTVFSTFLEQLQLDRNSKLEDAIQKIHNCPFSGTDCALPMLWAKAEGRQYDAFIIYTDNETWYSKMSPAQALREYRQHSGIRNARLAVVGMSSAGFTVADPQDLYMMDVVGFDTETPTVLQEFISGTICE